MDTTPAGTPALLRTLNARAVLDVLGTGAQVARPDVVAATGLSTVALTSASASETAPPTSPAPAPASAPAQPAHVAPAPGETPPPTVEEPFVLDGDDCPACGLG